MATHRQARLAAVSAAGAEASELVAEHDRAALRAVSELRAALDSKRMTRKELAAAAKVADDWLKLVDRRLKIDAKRAGVLAQLLAALAQPQPGRARLLRDELPGIDSIRSNVRVTVEMLEARAQIDEQLRGRP